MYMYHPYNSEVKVVGKYPQDNHPNSQFQGIKNMFKPPDDKNMFFEVKDLIIPGSEISGMEINVLFLIKIKYMYIKKNSVCFIFFC